MKTNLNKKVIAKELNLPVLPGFFCCPFANKGNRAIYFENSTNQGYKIKRISTHTDDFATAYKFIHENYGDLLFSRAGAKQEKDIIKTLQRSIENITKRSIVTEVMLADIPSLVADYDTKMVKKKKRKAKSDGTKKLYDYNYKRFLEYCLGINVTTFRQVTEDVANGYLDDTKMAKSTYNIALSGLQSYFKTIVMVMKKNHDMDLVSIFDEYDCFNRSEKVGDNETQAGKAYPKLPFSAEHKQKIFDYLEKFVKEKHKSNHHRIKRYWQVACRIGCDCGFRVSDVKTLRKTDIAGDETIVLKSEKKTNKETVRIAPKSIKAIRELVAEFPSESEYVFPAWQGLNDSTVSKQFQGILKAVGLYDLYPNGKTPKYQFHSFRHAKIDELKQAGYTTTDIQKLFAHSNEATTNGYGIEGTSREQLKLARKLAGLNLHTVSSIFDEIKTEVTTLTPEEKAKLIGLIQSA